VQTAGFHFVYIITGLLLITSLFLLMVSLGIPYRFAAVLSVLFSVAPDSILYENFILYTYPVATLLVLSCVTLSRYLSTNRWYWGMGTATLWCMVILTRSMFHLMWFGAGLSIIVVLFPRRWKRVLLLSLIPFLFAFGWYAKNYVMFDMFGTSSWLGMNVSRLTVSVLNDEEKLALARDGKISELAFLRPFPGYWQFAGNIDIPRSDSTGVSILDSEYIEFGNSNYTHLIQLSLAKQFLKDSFAVIRNYPDIYLFRSLRGSFGLYFTPCNRWFDIWGEAPEYGANVSALGPILTVFNTLFCGDFPGDRANVGWFIVVIYLATVGYWVYRLIREVPHMRQNAPFFTVILFMFMTVLYVTFVGNLFELGENMRFRYNVDPLVLTLFGLMLVDFLSRFSGHPRKRQKTIPKTA